MQNAAKAYLKTQVNTVSPGKLLIMLYEGAIKYLNQAKEKIEAKDFAAKGILISKAIDIISELDESLNAQRGGQIAENLHGLYFYCNTRLLKANMDMDPKIIDEVLKILESIKGAFMEVVRQQNGGETPNSTPPENPAAKADPGKQPRVGLGPKAAQKPKPEQKPEPGPPSLAKPDETNGNDEPASPGPASRPKTLPGAYGRIGGYK